MIERSLREGWREVPREVPREGEREESERGRGQRRERRGERLRQFDNKIGTLMMKQEKEMHFSSSDATFFLQEKVYFFQFSNCHTYKISGLYLVTV